MKGGVEVPSISYFLKRTFSMNYKAMFDRISVVKNKCNKSSLGIFLDMIWCGFKYGAGYVDYDVIGFYKLNSAQRKTMLTRGINNKYVRYFNEKDYWHLFNNKNEFNEMFADYLKRDWIYIKEDNKSQCLEWLKKHDTFFAKPNDGQCGKNIEKISASDWNNNPEEIYNHLITNKLLLLEEPVIQCPEMNKLNSSSVNTVRVVSIMNDNDEVTIIATFSRIGNGKIVDNFNSGGMTAKIDVETGIICEEAVDKEGKVYEKHPITGTTIKGFQIPYWNEAKELVKKASKLSPHIRYVGWDIGMSVNGPVLIEGNQFPGHDIYQVAEKIKPGDLGILPVFEEAINAGNARNKAKNKYIKLKKKC